MNERIYEFYEQIETQADFESFLGMLVGHWKKNGDRWQNDSLGSYLEALHGYNFDSAKDHPSVIPSWKVFAEMLLAAIVYE